MSSVYWVYKLVDGLVDGPEEDCYELYRHTELLDNICAALEIEEFSSMVDYTDASFCFEEKELPEGVEDTTELMARQGNWVAAADAVNVLSSLEQFISDSDNALDISSDARSGLILELRTTVTFASVAASEQGKLNLSVVF